VFNATFSNISAISWRPVLVVEEAWVPVENHRPWTLPPYTLVHDVLFRIHIGPGWLNELGSWVTQQLIQAYHQYGVGSYPALLITKTGALDLQPQVIKFTSIINLSTFYT
jgi:hypothetical protein